MSPHFYPNSELHWTSVLGVLAAVLLVCWLGRMMAYVSAKAEKRVARTLIWAVVIIHGGAQLIGNRPSHFDPSFTLPLHICDIVPWIGAYALWTRKRWARAVLYFGGFGLSTWALFIPALSLGPARWQFWFYWIGHGLIVALAAYDMFVRHYRPTRKAWAGMSATMLVYAGLMLSLNAWLGSNYGYLGPDSPATILGPWPGMIWKLLAVELAAFGLLMFPWTWGRRIVRAGISLRVPAGERQLDSAQR